MPYEYDAIRVVCLEEKDVLVVLPTGFGKSLIYQALLAIFDNLHFGGVPEKQQSVVIVVSPLNALLRDQVEKLERFLDVCIIVEDGDQKVMIPENVSKCCLLLSHPEVLVDCRQMTKVLKGKDFQKRVRAIVVDEAHMVLQWYGFFINFFSEQDSSSRIPTLE